MRADYDQVIPGLINDSGDRHVLVAAIRGDYPLILQLKFLTSLPGFDQLLRRCELVPPYSLELPVELKAKDIPILARATFDGFRNLGGRSTPSETPAVASAEESCGAGLTLRIGAMPRSTITREVWRLVQPKGRRSAV